MQKTIYTVIHNQSFYNVVTVPVQNVDFQNVFILKGNNVLHSFIVGSREPQKSIENKAFDIITENSFKSSEMSKLAEQKWNTNPTFKQSTVKQLEINPKFLQISWQGLPNIFKNKITKAQFQIK